MRVVLFIVDDGSITPWPLPEKERIKRNLSEGEKVLEFPLKLFRELFFPQIKAEQKCTIVNQNPHSYYTVCELQFNFGNDYNIL